MPQWLSVRAAVVAGATLALLAGAIAGAAAPPAPAPGTIQTIAGGGSLAPDGVPALEASLSFILGMAVDRNGDVFISDVTNCSIDKISHGMITRVVGAPCGPLAGPNEIGDGGPALEASLNRPEGLAFDSTGDLYISDSFNCEIRKVDAQTGIITAFAGKGPWYCGGQPGDGGLATDATVMMPNGLAVDQDDNVYFAELAECRVRKVSNGIISTVAGRPAECGSPADGDGGPAASAQLSAPMSVAVDGDGMLYIGGGGRIRAVQGGVISTIAGTDLFYDHFSRTIPAMEFDFATVTGMAVDRDGGLLISDAEHCRVVRLKDGMIDILVGGALFEGSGLVYTRCGSEGNGGPAVDAIIGEPTGVGVDDAGNVYFAEIDENGVRPTMVRVIYGATPTDPEPVSAPVRRATPTAKQTAEPTATLAPAPPTATPPAAPGEPPQAASEAPPGGGRAGAIIGPSTGTGATAERRGGARPTWLAGAMLLVGAGATSAGARRLRRR